MIVAACAPFPDPGGPPSRVAADAPFPSLLTVSQIGAFETPPVALTDDDPLLRRAAAVRGRAAALQRTAPVDGTWDHPLLQRVAAVEGRAAALQHTPVDETGDHPILQRAAALRASAAALKLIDPGAE